MSEETTLNWNCSMEVNLFHALRGHKPVGVNRHFHMIGIHGKMLGIYKKITAKQIWNFLGELWDLNALNESEIIPFPNKEAEFTLPESEFAELMNKAFPRLVLPQVEVKSEVMSEKDDIQSEDKTEKHKDEKTEKQKDEKTEKHKDEKTERHKDEKSERLKEDKTKKHKEEKEKSDSGKAPKSESRHLTGACVNNTSDSSLKRKRTRQQAPPSTASPAIPDAQPIKRRR